MVINDLEICRQNEETLLEQETPGYHSAFYVVHELFSATHILLRMDL